MAIRGRVLFSEVVKKWSGARFYLSYYSCTLYFLVKILLVNLKNLDTWAYSNLNYGTTKSSPKKWRSQRWWDLLKLLTNNLTSVILATFSVLKLNSKRIWIWNLYDFQVARVHDARNFFVKTFKMRFLRSSKC